MFGCQMTHIKWKHLKKKKKKLVKFCKNSIKHVTLKLFTYKIIVRSTTDVLHVKIMVH
jgi:hypothetical protein